MATTAIPVDAVALHMQIEECRGALDSLMAQRVALELNAGGCGAITNSSGADGEKDMDWVLMEVQLQELLGHAGAVAADALFRQDVSAAVANMKAAANVARQFASDETIAAHDHGFALSISRMDNDEWDEFGDNVGDTATQGAADIPAW